MKLSTVLSRKAAMAAVVTAIAVFVAPVVSAQEKIDVTGKWIFDVETSAGSGTPTVTLKQEGETLTGHYSSMQLGEADLTGTVKGRELTFSFTATVLDMKIPVTYSGTLDEKQMMKGKIVITGLGDGTFTGKKQ